MAFVRRHGVVLESAKGLEPSLTAFVAGEPIAGSWWAHPKAHAIFDVLQHVRASKAILVCALAGGKITYIHRSLWPYFVHAAGALPSGALDRIDEEHLPSGRHRRTNVPLATWLPDVVRKAALALPASAVEKRIGPWIDRYGRR